MDKPDVDHIEGLSPAISIDQKTTSRNPRSTVATVTEIYDYLRLLLRAGRRAALPDLRPADHRARASSRSPTTCSRCPRGPASWCSRRWCAGARASTATCSSRSAARASRGWRSTARRHAIDEVPALDKKFAHTIEVVVNRLVMRDDLRRRLTDSLETATGLSDGLVRIEEVAARRLGAAVVDLLRALRLPRARGLAARARAAHVLVQLAPRRLPAVHRARVHARGRPRDGRRRPSARSPRARSCPGPTAPPTTTTCCSGVIADQHGIDLDTPVAEAPRAPAHAAAARGPSAASALFLGRRRKGGGSWGWFEGVDPAAAAPARHLDVAGDARQRSSSSCRCGRARPAAGRA